MTVRVEPSAWRNFASFSFVPPPQVHPNFWPPGVSTHDSHSSGRKSQAVLSLMGGIPGVSGELKVRGEPTALLFAKEPGVVPWFSVEGLSPRGGRVKERSVVLGSLVKCMGA